MDCLFIIVYSVLGWMSMDSFSWVAGMDGLSLYIIVYSVLGWMSMDSFSGGAGMDGLSLYIYNCIFCFRVDENGFFLRWRRHGWTVSLYIYLLLQRRNISLTKPITL